MDTVITARNTSVVNSTGPDAGAILRVYKASPDRANIQIFTFRGKQQVIASAALSRMDLKKVQAAIEEALSAFV